MAGNLSVVQIDMIKIAVYTIALDEEKHVRRWYESAKDADLLLIADTGSSDGTVRVAEKLGVKVFRVEVNPWRFDVARNASLALVPNDYDICIQLDMDEILPKGWRAKVEKAWNEGNIWPIYKHVTSRNSSGEARHFQEYFKIHPRKDFYWKYPIHEVVVPKEGTKFKRAPIDLEIDHVKDLSKSRGSYLPLLESAVQEMPNDWRMSHYLAREYWYQKDWLKVLQTAEKALKIIGGWDVERASTCMWASESALQLGFLDWAADWARRGTEEASNFYETWHWRAHICHLQNKWEECFEFSEKILTLNRQNHHLVKPEVWEWWGFDLMALSAHQTNRSSEAVYFGKRALSANPDDKRLLKNLDFYRSKRTELWNSRLRPSNERRKKVKPTVLWAILAKDAEELLPLYLESLLNQSFPRDQIGLYIRTNDNKDKTADILWNFISVWGTEFLEVFIDDTSINSGLKAFAPHEWNRTRFEIMAQIRQESIEFAIEKGYDYYFASDTDNFLLSHTLKTTLERNLDFVAPMLRMAVPEETSDKVENRNTSNFYFSDEGLWFKDDSRYYSIINREKPGLHKVDVAHCTYLLTSKALQYANFSHVFGDWEYKNLVRSLSCNGIGAWVDNTMEFGVLTLSKDPDICRYTLSALRDANELKDSTSAKSTFTRIYATSEWGYRSGPGSNPEAANWYIEEVNSVINQINPRTILDIGCGDFRVASRFVLGEETRYLGIDVTPAVINSNLKFQTKSIKFECIDIEEFDWKETWDLILVKDVLQHLPNANIKNIIDRIMSHCENALFCNDFDAANHDVSIGGYRGIDLQSEPFGYSLETLRISGKKHLLRYKGGNVHKAELAKLV